MEKKTTLQKIIEQKTEQVCNAIERAIDEGAKVEHSMYVHNGYIIDGVFIQTNTTNNICICLNMKSEIIAKVCKPSKDELEKLAAQKRSELEEIEKQLKFE